MGALSLSGLVLSRRPHERIFIGDDIVIEVIGIHGGQTRFKIDAPAHVIIDREEIRERRIRDSLNANSGGTR